jgi:hypothetical protein
MAYKVVAGDVLRMGIFNWAAGQLGLMTFHYVVTSTAGTSVTLGDIAANLDSIVQPVMTPMMSTQAQYLGIKLGTENVSPVPAPQIIENATAGSSAGDLLPTQVAGVITWKTDYIGRAFRGRNYFPFPSEIQNQQNDLPTNGYITLMSNFAVAVAATIVTTSGANSATIDPVIWHRNLTSWTAITQWRLNQRWGTQRRRGQYGQGNAVTIS